MFCPKVRLKKPWTLALTTAALISLAHLAFSPTAPLTAYAHKVEIKGDVGATLHIEPNDMPKAGEEVLAWFALTRPGGEPISLENCNCTLAVYAQAADQPYQGKTPDLTPNLAAVDAEGYQDIPGAQLTFPSVGTYTLVISGEPKQAGDFTPFSLDFEKTIASGASIPVVPANKAAALPSPEVPVDIPVAVKDPPSGQIEFIKWVTIGVMIAGFVWAISRLFRRPK